MKKLLLLVSVIFFTASCCKETQKVESSEQNQIAEKAEIPLDSLKKFAGETKKLLVKNVTQKMEEGGAENALEFCNVEAIPLTKSASEKYGLKISRVTDKPRNPDNLANAEELQLIEKYKKQILAGEELKFTRTATHYYEPLVTNALCIQCHGMKGKDIKPKVVEKIAQLYPKDLAFGYKENEIRGLIKIETE